MTVEAAKGLAGLIYNTYLAIRDMNTLGLGMPRESLELSMALMAPDKPREDIRRAADVVHMCLLQTGLVRYVENEASYWLAPGRGAMGAGAS